MYPDDSGGIDPAFAASLAGLVKASRGRVSIGSGYRTPGRQSQLFDAAVAKYGSEAAARHWVAPPGQSNHNRGLAADLSGDMGLAHNLAPQFGLHFPMDYEKWHVEPMSTRKVKATSKNVAGPVLNAQEAPRPPVTTNQNGDIDLSSVLHWLSNPQSAPLNLYNPDAAKSAPNPNYSQPSDVAGQFTNPSSLGDLVGANDWMRPQVAAGPPPDLRQFLEQPSDNASFEQNSVSAQQANPASTDPRVAELNAISEHNNSLAKLAKDNPAVMQVIPDYLQYPTRQEAPIPTPPQPKYDAMSGGLATLAALLDPQHAGQYGSAPLQAGMADAAQRQQEGLQHYAMLHDQLSRQYEDQLSQRNDLAHYVQQKNGANFANASANRENALKAGEYKIAGDNRGLASALTSIGEREKSAGAYGLQAQLAKGRIDTGLAQNAFKINAAAAARKDDKDLLKALIAGGVRGQSSQNTFESRQYQADIQAQINQGKNEAAGQRANDKADLAVLLSNMRGAQGNQHDNRLDARQRNQIKADVDAAAIKGKAIIGSNQFPPEIRSQLSTLGHNYSSAFHQAQMNGADPYSETQSVAAREEYLNAVASATRSRQPVVPQAAPPARPSRPVLNSGLTGLRRGNRPFTPAAR